MYAIFFCKEMRKALLHLLEISHDFCWTCYIKRTERFENIKQFYKKKTYLMKTLSSEKCIEIYLVGFGMNNFRWLYSSGITTTDYLSYLRSWVLLVFPANIFYFLCLFSPKKGRIQITIIGSSELEMYIPSWKFR